MDEIERKYDDFYRKRNPEHVYPVEFVVRAFLGNYPRHRSDTKSYLGKRVLDLGFGDGRNMPLLRNLGMEVFGVEISQEICDLTKNRMKGLGIEVDLKVGRNRDIPYSDDCFDAVLACHSCYYIDLETRFDHNLREIARVLPDSAPITIGTDHVVFRTFYLLRRAEGRVEGPASLDAIVRGGQAQVLFSEDDLGGALARGASGMWEQPVVPGGELQREHAIRLAVNIAMYVLCSNYKDDQVHAPFLMRRRALTSP